MSLKLIFLQYYIFDVYNNMYNIYNNIRCNNSHNLQVIALLFFLSLHFPSMFN